MHHNIKNLEISMSAISKDNCFQDETLGRAIAQAVSRRLPNVTDGSNPGVVMWDFVMDKSGAGAGFLRELRFPHANLHSICFSTIIFSITRGWHNRPGVAAVRIASQTK
jgi:hypothetical protein